MESKKPSNTLKMLKIIHWALMGGPVVFAVVVYVLLSANSEPPQFFDSENILSYFPMGLAVTSIFLSSFLFDLFLKQNVKDKIELTQKLAAFQTAHIVRIAILEGAAMFAVVICLLTSSLINYGTFIILLLFMYVAAPTKEKLIALLELSQNEIIELDGSFN